MQRSIVDVLSTHAAPALEREEITTFAARRPLPRWLLVCGFWTLIVIVYSTRGEIRVGPYQWVAISWIDSLKSAAAQWYTWGVLSVAIYWINRKLPFAPDALWQRLLVHVPLSIAFTIAYAYLNRGATLLLDAPNDPDWVGTSLLATASRVAYRFGTFIYWAIAMICVALEYQGHLKDREIQTARLKRSLSEARMAALRSQFDPHFLFNTLNSISAYVESAPRQARLMIEQLGDLLRLSLDDADQQEIPLERELAFIDRYIQLQLVRFADRLDVQVRVDPEVLAAAVPTFLLQPLVENAIRHGTSTLTASGVIELSAWRSGEHLRVRVRDNGPGLPKGWTIERNTGIGLGNTRARLEQLYGKGRVHAGDRVGRREGDLRGRGISVSRGVSTRVGTGMVKIRTVVVDDEKPARVRLLELLQRESDVEVVGTASDGRDALDLVRRVKPDLLFLDIQMPKLDGFGVLQQLSPDTLPITVVVTAFDKYAIQAFDAHAIDYLLKPFSDQRFDDALSRARKYLGAAEPREQASQLTAAAGERKSVDAISGYLERVVLKSNGCITFLDVDDVDWIEAADVYVYLHVGPNRHLYRSSVTHLLQRLDPRRFVRIHRSTAVNTSRIRELHARSHGDFTLVLKGGHELSLSRAYRSHVEAWLRQPI